MYNPPSLPAVASYPLAARIQVEAVEVGRRALPAAAVHGALTKLPAGTAGLHQPGLAYGSPLETCAADLLLTCKVGQPLDSSRDGQVRYFLERRSGPIGAALAVSITLPE